MARGLAPRSMQCVAYPCLLFRARNKRHHSERRIIPSNFLHASNSWVFVPHLSFPTRNNPGVLFLQLRNEVSRKDNYARSILFLGSPMGPSATWPFRAPC